MKGMIVGVALAAGLLTAGTAHAGDMVLVFADGANMVGMDVGALSREGDVATASFVWVDGSDEKMAGREVGHTAIKQDFDCKNSLTRVTFMGIYDTAGQAIEARQQTNAWKEVAPNSSGWAWLKAACDADFRRGLASFSITPAQFVTGARQSLKQMANEGR